MAIDTSIKSQGKETYNFVIYSTDRINNGVAGTYNYNDFYNVDWSSLLRHFPDNQKFRLKWAMGSRTTSSHSGDHQGLLFVDFGSRYNQQDTKLNNNVNNLGMVEFTFADANNYWIRHAYENTYTTITKPTINQIRVYFRLCDNSNYWNGSNLLTDNLPNFCLKIELQPIYDE